MVVLVVLVVLVNIGAPVTRSYQREVAEVCQTQEPLAVRTFSRRLRLMTIIILELLAIELKLIIFGLVIVII